MARTLTLAFCAMVLLSQSVLPGSAQAQTNYPTRNITLVVGFAAGGSSDIIARLIGQKIGEYTGTNVIIENIAGAATTTATEKVARAAPDGYTLYLPTSTPFATNPNFYSKLRYSFDDFEPITLVARMPLGFDVRPDFPGSTVKEFVEYARKKPDGVTIATPGRGSVGEIINGMARGILDIKITDVPYRGAGPAMQDLLKGVVDSYFDAISSSVPLYHAGRIKMFGLTGRTRSPALPNVPTMIELGYKDFVLENVFSVVAPKGTPRPVVDKLNGLIRRAMEEPKFREILLAQGIVPEPSTPEELRKIIREDYEWNASMVKRFNIPRVD